MSSKDVDIVSLVGAKDEWALKQGSIDALVTSEPTISKLKAMGAKLLFDSRQIPDEIMDVVVIRESVLTKQTTAAQALTTGWFRALDYLQRHPADAARRIAPHSGIKPLEFLKSLNSIRIPDVQSNKKILEKTDAASLNAGSRLAKFMLEKKLLKKAVEPTSRFDARLVQNIEISLFKNH